MTLRELIRRTTRRLAAARLHYGHGTDNPRDEAAWLVIRGLGLPFDADLGMRVDPAGVESLLARRIKERIPVAYLLHEAWQDGCRFYVDQRVLVPRSHIAFLLKSLPLRRSPERVLDLCTGSGCLAILAARAFPKAKVTATDISPAALEVAATNVSRYRLKRRIRLRRSDLFAKISGRFDLILTNPPYVAATAMARLPLEYRAEPDIALGSGRDGLDAVRRILMQARVHLAPDGLLVCEIGEGRRALQRAYPRLPFIWAGESVFLLDRPPLPG